MTDLYCILYWWPWLNWWIHTCKLVVWFWRRILKAWNLVKSFWNWSSFRTMTHMIGIIKSTVDCISFGKTTILSQSWEKCCFVYIDTLLYAVTGMKEHSACMKFHGQLEKIAIETCRMLKIGCSFYLSDFSPTIHQHWRLQKHSFVHDTINGERNTLIPKVVIEAGISYNSCQVI